MERSILERRTIDKLSRDLGPVIARALADERTTEILLNPDGRLWQERLGEDMRCIGMLEAHRAEAVIKTVASHLDRPLDKLCPLLEGELPPSGARFAGQLPPVVQAPTFSIRVPALQVMRLESYVELGTLTPAHHAALTQAVAERRNLLVVGGTGSGKTTLVNAIIGAMVTATPSDRVVVIEDTREIRCTAPNCVQYRAGKDVSMTELLRTTLRMRPDRILVGEVRGAEALDLLMAWNTGHPGGAATVHANSAYAGLSRLEMLLSMHPQAPARPEVLIADAVDLVVHIARTPQGRCVQEVLEVQGVANGGYVTKRL